MLCMTFKKHFPNIQVCIFPNRGETKMTGTVTKMTGFKIEKRDFSVTSALHHKDRGNGRHRSNIFPLWEGALAVTSSFNKRTFQLPPFERYNRRVLAFIERSGSFPRLFFSKDTHLIVVVLHNTLSNAHTKQHAIILIFDYLPLFRY